MNFKSPEQIETPYVRARAEWDSRIGTVREMALLWRTTALMALGCTALSTMGLIYQSTKASVEPYVIEVDSRGEVRLVGTPEAQRWTPDESLRRFFVQKWVRSVREISNDEAVVKRYWLDAYAHVTPKAKAQLDEYAREAMPFQKMGEESRTIQVESITQASQDSTRVEWLETIRNKSGVVVAKQRWMGLIELQYSRPKTVEQLEQNPLGFWVSHFSWSHQLDMGGLQ